MGCNSDGLNQRRPAGRGTASSPYSTIKSISSAAKIVSIVCVAVCGSIMLPSYESRIRIELEKLDQRLLAGIHDSILEPELRLLELFDCRNRLGSDDAIFIQFRIRT